VMHALLRLQEKVQKGDTHSHRRLAAARSGAVAPQLL
jgi:hypothetical protein